MRQQVVDKLDVLKGYFDELEAQSVRIREVARELGVDDVDTDSGLATSGR
jgi:hypothetical protein